MKICPKCKAEHNKSGTYCSRSCANSRTWTAEDKLKKSLASSTQWVSLSEDERKQRIDATSKLVQIRKVTDLMESEWDVLSYQGKRKRVIIEQDGKCNNCGIDKWQGHLLTLELEHKNADNKDNSRNNLEALCPNCHSLTPSWRGKQNRGIVSASRETIHRHTAIFREIQ